MAVLPDRATDLMAVEIVVMSYALGHVGTQVLSVALISALGLTTTAPPAKAW